MPCDKFNKSGGITHGYPAELVWEKEEDYPIEPQSGELEYEQELPEVTTFIGILDISDSMANQDYPPTRLEAGKQGFLKFAEQRRIHNPNDFIGLVTFNHQAVPHFPPKWIGDPYFMEELKQSLERITAFDGTNLDKGLTCAWDSINQLITDDPYAGTTNYWVRFLVLTDGHSGGDPVVVANWLKENGVVIEIVGIGGSPAAVNEPMLKQCASWENDRLLYRFIGDGDSEELVNYFGNIALR